jgi:hypothetical protein
LHSLTELPTLNWLLNQIRWNLLYNRWFTANQSVSASSPLRLMTRDFFSPLDPCGHSPYVTSSLMRRWVWPFVKRTYRTYGMLLKILPCALYTSPVSTGFAKQIMPVLRILCYNGNLATWTFISLMTTTKFKPLIFSMSGFALSYTANMFILMILYDFCLLPA